MLQFLSLSLVLCPRRINAAPTEGSLKEQAKTWILLAQVPISPITGILPEWLHKMVASTNVPEPSLIPRENNIWMADTIL